MSEKINQVKGTRTNVEVDLLDSVAQGSYANLVIISHSPTEFILDFAAMLPGMPKPKVNDRIILAPEHAKRLLRSLKDNIAKYEGNYGPITDIETAMHERSQQEAMTLFEISPKIGEA